MKYPFKTMEVGDGFIADEKDAASATSGASIFGRRTGRRFGTKRISRTQVLIYRKPDEAAEDLHTYAIVNAAPFLRHDARAAEIERLRMLLAAEDTE